ncbi:ECF transporter S component [Sporomusa sp. KB1]|uniref:ECF transporter S component n=1 Tax=Sporomusa sp. KB1 TaxID=943346 RepID=UPI00119ED156|nr:ECF transporter S component [Sporomusa sp. KB1]TWH48053.1 putative membrane protein [Sporomusa sp. KB1]
MEQQSFSQTKQLVYAALGIALVFICTVFVNVRLPIAANGGLIHLGNVPLFIIAILYGRYLGALAGGIGMALFDVVGGWFLWAPFTLVIVGLMGYTVGAICEKHRSLTAYVLALAAACLIKVVGYYGAEGVIYGNLLAPMTSVPGNLVQIGVASVIVLPIVVKLRKHVAVISWAASRK